MWQLGVWASGLADIHVTAHGSEKHLIVVGARTHCQTRCCVMGDGVVTLRSGLGGERCFVLRMRRGMIYE